MSDERRAHLSLVARDASRAAVYDLDRRRFEATRARIEREHREAESRKLAAADITLMFAVPLARRNARTHADRVMASARELLAERRRDDALSMLEHFDTRAAERRDARREHLDDLRVKAAREDAECDRRGIDR